MKKQTWSQWVRVVEREARENPAHPSRLRRGCLAPLTGTDVRAMTAFVACIDLYSYCDHPEEALRAAAIVLGQMQESVRWIARELIPFVREWEDRDRLWPRIVGASLHVVGDDS
jgi:hypothetical protein